MFSFLLPWLHFAQKIASCGGIVQEKFWPSVLGFMRHFWPKELNLAFFNDNAKTVQNKDDKGEPWLNFSFWGEGPLLTKIYIRLFNWSMTCHSPGDFESRERASIQTSRGSPHHAERRKWETVNLSEKDLFNFIFSIWVVTHKWQRQGTAVFLRYFVILCSAMSLAKDVNKADERRGRVVI